MRLGTREIPNLPDDLRRCCRDSMQHDAPDDPTEGVEVPCRWCLDYLIFRAGRWERPAMIDDARIIREASPEAVAARETSYQDLVSQPITIPHGVPVRREEIPERRQVVYADYAGVVRCKMCLKPSLAVPADHYDELAALARETLRYLDDCARGRAGYHSAHEGILLARPLKDLLAKINATTDPA